MLSQPASRVATGSCSVLWSLQGVLPVVLNMKQLEATVRADLEIYCECKKVLQLFY